LNSLAARMYGVIRRPRATFTALAGTPSWLPVLAATTAITFLGGIAFLGTDVGRQALVDQWERTATAFGQTLDDAGYARMQETADSGTFRLLYAAVTALTNGPVLVLAVSGLLFLMLKPRRPFAEVLTIASYSTVILALRQVIATPVDFMRETIASPTTLVGFFSMLDEASPVARFLGVIDLFVVWWIVVLAIGASLLYRRPTRRLAIAFTGAYVALALLAALAMAVSGGTA